jgi:hypothetical protein
VVGFVEGYDAALGGSLLVSSIMVSSQMANEQRT